MIPLWMAKLCALAAIAPQRSPQNPAVGVAHRVNMPKRNTAKRGALNSEKINCR